MTTWHERSNAHEGERIARGGLQRPGDDALATKEKDAESYPLLDWFLTEQVEEEDSVQKIIGKL